MLFPHDACLTQTLIEAPTIFLCCITAFLNEAGFNFVRKCIDLVEIRGEAF